MRVLEPLDVSPRKPVHAEHEDFRCPESVTVPESLPNYAFVQKLLMEGIFKPNFQVRVPSPIPFIGGIFPPGRARDYRMPRRISAAGKPIDFSSFIKFRTDDKVFSCFVSPAKLRERFIDEDNPDLIFGCGSVGCHFFGGGARARPGQNPPRRSERFSLSAGHQGKC
jgi:hypothetical protein